MGGFTRPARRLPLSDKPASLQNCTNLQRMKLKGFSCLQPLLESSICTSLSAMLWCQTCLLRIPSSIWKLRMRFFGSCEGHQVSDLAGRPKKKKCGPGNPLRRYLKIIPHRILFDSQNTTSHGIRLDTLYSSCFTSWRDEDFKILSLHILSKLNADYLEMQIILTIASTTV